MNENLKKQFEQLAEQLPDAELRNVLAYAAVMKAKKTLDDIRVAEFIAGIA